MAKVGLMGCAARRAACTAASAWVSANRAWSRKARPAAVNSIPCTLAHQLNADLIFEISDLATEGRLRRVQPFLRCERQAFLLRDRDEIAKVP
jgi:hypothetical protein